MEHHGEFDPLAVIAGRTKRWVICFVAVVAGRGLGAMAVMDNSTERLSELQCT
jgi:hypothetical protein